MKKVYAINGSPRRNRNTATLLDKVLEGCRDAFPGMVETDGEILRIMVEKGIQAAT